MTEKKTVAKRDILLHLNFKMTEEDYEKWKEDVTVYIVDFTKEIVYLVDSHKHEMAFPDFIDVEVTGEDVTD